MDREPSPTKLWRYMDLAKYISLLKTQGLYFSRVSLLEDPWEGATPALERHPLYRDNPFAYPADQIEDKLVELAIPHPSEEIESLRDQMYVSCWHLNEGESFAMWKLYSSSHESVAVVTTLRHLRGFLPRFIRAGKIQYIDYSNERIGSRSPYQRFLRKRKSFEHERELRALAWSKHPSFVKLFGETRAPGVLVPLDISKVIQEIVVNPYAPSWYKGLVEDVTRKYNLAAPVRQSSLSSPALF